MSHDEALARIAELEKALERKTFEAEMHKQSVKSLLHLIPFEPLSEEDGRKLMSDTGGPSIQDFLDELKREVA